MDYKKLTDDELVKLSQASDEFAQTELISRYSYIAKSKARFYFLNDGDFEDLIQVATIAIYKAIMSYKPPNNLASYINVCVKNSINTLIKNSKNSKNAPLDNYYSLSGFLDGDIDKNPVVLDSDYGPEDNYLNEERRNELQNIIKKTLSKLEYEIFSVYLQGYSYEEIAERIGKNTKSIDNAIQRIKNKLDKVLLKAE